MPPRLGGFFFYPFSIPQIFPPRKGHTANSAKTGETGSLVPGKGARLSPEAGAGGPIRENAFLGRRKTFSIRKKKFSFFLRFPLQFSGMGGIMSL